MRHGLLGRPRLLLGLLLLEALLVAPTGWLLTVLLGRGADTTLRTDALLQLDARAWAEWLFVDQPRLGALLLPIGFAVVVWWMVGAALPATFFAALGLGERGAAVASYTVRYAPSLWQLALRGVLLRLALLVPSALVAGALFRSAHSFTDYVHAMGIAVALAAPALVIATVWIDTARLLLLVGEERPIRAAWGELRAKPARLITLGAGYALAGAIVTAGFVLGAPAMAMAMSGLAVWTWRALFVTARLLVASGRLLGVQAILTDSK